MYPHRHPFKGFPYTLHAAGLSLDHLELRHAPDRVKDAFYYQITTTYALLIKCSVSLLRGNITLPHATVAIFIASSQFIYISWFIPSGLSGASIDSTRFLGRRNTSIADWFSLRLDYGSLFSFTPRRNRHGTASLRHPVKGERYKGPLFFWCSVPRRL